MRGFVRGLLWGSVAAAGGLVVVSQIAGPVSRPADLTQGDVPAAAAEGIAQENLASDGTLPETVSPESAAGTAAVAEVVTPEVAPSEDTPTEDTPTGPAGVAEVSEPVVPEVTAPVAPVSESPVSESPAPETQPLEPSAPVVVTDAPEAPHSAVRSAEVPSLPAPADATPVRPPAEAPAVPQSDRAAAMIPAPAEPPAAPPSDAPAERMASAGQVSPPPAAPAAGDSPMAAAQPDSPGLPEAEAAPAAADLPPLPPLTPEEEALLLPLPPDVPADPAPAVPEPADPTPEPMAPPQPTDEAAEQGTLAPAPAPGGQTTGVVTGRLPRIGADPAPAGAAEAVIDVSPDMTAEEDLPPRLRYARPFENPAQKPLFAILLQDNGQDGVNRAELAALDLPLSIVIDPLSEGAAARAAIWRAGGQEVVMAGTGIPEGAGPGDLEQSFQVLASRLPEAVAVIDPDGRAFQNNRPLAAQVVPILAEQGRGLVTFDQGLNAADQVARREGLAAAVIFRSIDGEGEASPVIRRYLDRAAFKAAQEGRVIVIGALRPDTLAGILEWAVEGRASTVALAPVSAMLQPN